MESESFQSDEEEEEEEQQLRIERLKRQLSNKFTEPPKEQSPSPETNSDSRLVCIVEQVEMRTDFSGHSLIEQDLVIRLEHCVLSLLPSLRHILIEGLEVEVWTKDYNT